MTFDNACWPAYETLSWYKMRMFTMFINSVCVSFFIKLRWPLFHISLLYSWVLCRIFKSSLKLANRSTSTGLFWFTFDDEMLDTKLGQARIIQTDNSSKSHVNLTPKYWELHDQPETFINYTKTIVPFMAQSVCSLHVFIFPCYST